MNNKIIVILLIFLLLFPCFAENKKPIVLIVYYSARGHTQAMAEAMFQAGADTEEHQKDVWPDSECCLSGIRAMYFHAVIFP